MYVELHAYQHHAFMDWRFVDDPNWEMVHSNLNGAGVESMQAKWDEMFGIKDDEVVEEVKIKKPRKKAVAKKAVKSLKKTVASKTGKSTLKSSAKKPVKKTTNAKPKVVMKKVVKKSVKKSTNKTRSQ